MTPVVLSRALGNSLRHGHNNSKLANPVSAPNDAISKQCVRVSAAAHLFHGRLSIRVGCSVTTIVLQISLSSLGDIIDGRVNRDITTGEPAEGREVVLNLSTLLCDRPGRKTGWAPVFPRCKYASLHRSPAGVTPTSPLSQSASYPSLSPSPKPPSSFGVCEWYLPSTMNLAPMSPCAALQAMR